MRVRFVEEYSFADESRVWYVEKYHPGLFGTGLGSFWSFVAHSIDIAEVPAKEKWERIKLYGPDKQKKILEEYQT